MRGARCWFQNRTLTRWYVILRALDTGISTSRVQGIPDLAQGTGSTLSVRARCGVGGAADRVVRHLLTLVRVRVSEG